MESLVTPEEFAAYLQRDLDRSTAEVAVAGASGVVRQWCRWNITRTTESMEVDSGGSQYINLPTLHLRDVNSLTVAGELVDASSYTWSRAGQLYRAQGWPRGFRMVDAVVDHGYDDIPDEIRIVVLSLAARYYVNPEGLRSKTVGNASRVFVLETMRGDLAELEIRLIAGYRIP